MKTHSFIFLFYFLSLQLFAQNFIANGGFEDFPTGTNSYIVTNSGSATGKPNEWQLTFVSPGSTGNSDIVADEKYSGEKSIKIEIVNQTNRNDIRLFQSMPAIPSGKYVLSFYAKSDTENYPITIDVLKSTQATNVNGSAPLANRFQTTTGWKQFKAYIDISSWTDAERNNMRVSIRPNTVETTATPTGPYPKTFWIDDIVFEPYRDEIELKNIAVEVLQRRIDITEQAGFTEEAQTLRDELEILINSNPSNPVIPEKGIGFFPEIKVIENNPFINSLLTWGNNYKAANIRTYHKASKTNWVFPQNTYDECRSLGQNLENLHWLLVSPHSELRSDPTLFRYFLEHVYATSDDYLLNGATSLHIPGSTANGMDDWFAAGPIAYSWRMACLSFAGYIPQSLQQVMKDAAAKMGGAHYQIAQQIEDWVYTNRDVSYAEALMHTGMFLENTTWIDYAKRIVDITEEKSLYPDGAYSYIRLQNECSNYHGGNNNSMAKLYAVSEYQPAWDCIAAAGNWELLSLPDGLCPEFYTASSWKTMWNNANGFSGEPLLSITGNPYLKSLFDIDKTANGYKASPLYASFYRNDIESKPVPDNYIVYDRNIQGPRGKYGEYSFAVTTRNAATNASDVGLQTMAGSMTTQPGRKAPLRELNSSFMSAHPKVHVRTGSTEWTDWAYAAENLDASVSVSKYASGVSAKFNMQRQNAGPSAYTTNWAGFQEWIVLPDRQIGLIQVFPKPGLSSAQAIEINGCVKLGYGRSGNLNPQVLTIDEPGKYYSYGKLKVVVHGHDFTSVDTCTAGVLRDDVKLAKEIRFRYNLSPDGRLYTYPGTTKKYFIVEIKHKDATGDAEVEKVETDGMVGMVVNLNGKKYSVWRNTSVNPINADVSKGIDAGNINEIHFGRGDTNEKDPEILTGNTVSLEANEHIFILSTNDENDCGKGWENFDELLENEGLFPNSIIGETTGGNNLFTGYPNPVNGYYYIQTEMENLSVELFDMAGKLILSKELNGKDGNLHRIDLSSVAKGSYILNGKTKEASHTVKLIKQ